MLSKFFSWIKACFVKDGRKGKEKDGFNDNPFLIL